MVADYGTGPSNASAKYWDGIVTAFQSAHPDIKVNVTSIAWTNFDQQVQTMIQNKQYPDITEGDYFSNYAQDGLLYPATDVLSDPSNLLPGFKNQGTYNGTQYGMPFTTSSRPSSTTRSCSRRRASPPRRRPGPTSRPTPRRSRRSATSASACRSVPRRRRPSRCCGCSAPAAVTRPRGKYTINSAANVEAFTFLKGLVAAGDTQPNPGTVNRTDLWQQFAQGKVGMINGSPALIPIIAKAGVLQAADWTSVPIAGKSGPLTTTLGVCDNVAAFKPNGHAAQIKEFLDFAYQDKYQLQFDKEYDLLPATTSAAKALSSDPVFAPFLTALPNSVQYPSDTSWANIKTKIQQTIGTAVTGTPATELGQLQQIASTSAS